MQRLWDLGNRIWRAGTCMGDSIRAATRESSQNLQALPKINERRQLIDRLRQAHFPNMPVTPLTSTTFRVDQGVAVYHPALLEAVDAITHWQGRRWHTNLRFAPCVHSSLEQDARTEIGEILKAFLRSAAIRRYPSLEELEQAVQFCQGIVIERELFSDNGFFDTIADVARRVEQQKEHCLEQSRDSRLASLQEGRSCSLTLETLLMHSRSSFQALLEFALVGFTKFRSTDELPSVGAQTVWESLPEQWNCQPRGSKFQKRMEDVWRTGFGRVVAAMLSSTAFRKLMHQRESAPEHQSVSVRVTIAEVKQELLRGCQNSGFADVFESGQHAETRELNLELCQVTDDLIHMFGILSRLCIISQTLGDLGIMKVAPRLHPFLKELVEKVQLMQRIVVDLKARWHTNVVMGRLTLPTVRMQKRASEAIKESEKYSQMMLEGLNTLRLQSDPQNVVGLWEDTTQALAEFLAELQALQGSGRVSPGFHLPELLGVGQPLGRPAIQFPQLALAIQNA